MACGGGGLKHHLENFRLWYLEDLQSEMKMQVNSVSGHTQGGRLTTFA